MVGADPIARAQAASEHDGRTSRKRNGGELKPYHAPWDTCPVHCLDLVSGRLAIDDKSPEDNWNYFKKPTAILAWRSECPLFVLFAVMYIALHLGSLAIAVGKVSPSRVSARALPCAACASSMLTTL